MDNAKANTDPSHVLENLKQSIEQEFENQGLSIEHVKENLGKSNQTLVIIPIGFVRSGKTMLSRALQDLLNDNEKTNIVRASLDDVIASTVGYGNFTRNLDPLLRRQVRGLIFTSYYLNVPIIYQDMTHLKPSARLLSLLSVKGLELFKQKIEALNNKRAVFSLESVKRYINNELEKIVKKLDRENNTEYFKEFNLESWIKQLSHDMVASFKSDLVGYASFKQRLKSKNSQESRLFNNVSAAYLWLDIDPETCLERPGNEDYKASINWREVMEIHKKGFQKPSVSELENVLGHGDLYVANSDNVAKTVTKLITDYFF